MKRNILLIGSGGREHAIAWKLAQSSRVGKMYAIPGNAGIAGLAECHSEIGATELDKIVAFVAAHPDIYMTVVAPDDPLALGLVDKLNAAGYRAFGPTARAAEIEASKVFSKNLMQKYGIPTAAYETFSDYETADAYLDTCPIPVVIKADGLALGKGVLICTTRDEAKQGLSEIMQGNAFGTAGQRVVIEEFLTGFEVSVLAFCDGETVVPMVSSQDHKRALDGDRGLNTGGMGTFSPQTRYTDNMSIRAYDEIFLPTVRALKAEGREFKGVIYFGLMVGETKNEKRKTKNVGGDSVQDFVGGDPLGAPYLTSNVCFSGAPNGSPPTENPITSPEPRTSNPKSPIPHSPFPIPHSPSPIHNSQSKS